MAVDFIFSCLNIFVLVLLPVFAGLMIISPFFPNNAVKIRRFAKGFCIFNLVYTIFFTLFLNPETSTFGFIKKLPFDMLPGLNAALSFGLDSFSALMCLLTSFIMLLALMASKTMINSKYKLYYSLMLILQGAITGIFAANDLFTFFIFWELELIPMYFLISMWGGSEAKKSAMRFVLFTFAGSILMFISIALLYAYGADTGVMLDFESLIKNSVNFPIVLQLISCIGFLAAFAVKLPVFPLHSWLKDAHTKAPTPVSMVLAGILLKTGAYGLIRINLQMFYEIFQLMAPALIFLGAIGVVFASYCAISQNDIKKIIAYSSIAHMGIVLIGICSYTEFGLNGAIFYMIAHGLISAGLFMGQGIIHQKFKTRKLELLGGISNFVPQITVLMLILSASYIAIPFTMGFSGEILSLMGGFSSPLIEKGFFMTNFIQVSVITAALGIILCAVYVLRMLHRTFFGLVEYNFGEIKLSNHQTAILAILAFAVIIFGIYPMGIIDNIAAFSNINITTIIANIF